MQRNRISSASLFRQLSTFPGSRLPSIIDVKELNFRVRDGNGWTLIAINTDLFILTDHSAKIKYYLLFSHVHCKQW